MFQASGQDLQAFLDGMQRVGEEKARAGRTARKLQIPGLTFYGTAAALPAVDDCKAEESARKGQGRVAHAGLRGSR